MNRSFDLDISNESSEKSKRFSNQQLTDSLNPEPLFDMSDSL